MISQSKQSGLEGIDIRLPDPVRKPSSMAGVLAGVALFVFLGVMYAVQSAIISKPVPEEKQILDILVLLTLILPAVGFVVGWIQGFPRWWYPYAGHMLVYSLVLSVQSLEGRGLDRLAGRDLPGWTTWLPLITAIVISLLLTRSAKPLRSLVSGLRDLSFLNFALMGGYTWYIYAILIDNPGLSELPVLIAAFTILAVCAWLVLRSTRLIHRALAIVFSFLLVNSFFVLQDLLTAFNKNEYGPSSTTGIVIWLVLSMFTLAPILVMLIVNAFKRNVMPPSGGEVGS